MHTKFYVGSVKVRGHLGALDLQFRVDIIKTDNKELWREDVY